MRCFQVIKNTLNGKFLVQTNIKINISKNEIKKVHVLLVN